jgi:hypothetical protein
MQQAFQNTPALIVIYAAICWLIGSSEKKGSTVD